MDKNSAAVPLTLGEDIDQIFRKFDSNGDGKISLSELGAILNGLGSASSPDEVSRLMSELDTDGDGFIDLGEFKAFHCSGADSKEMKEAFDLYDMDKNGKISASELRAMLQTLGEKCSLKDCVGMIKSVDADGDGCVNFEEFKKMMSR